MVNAPYSQRLPPPPQLSLGVVFLALIKFSGALALFQVLCCAPPTAFENHTIAFLITALGCFCLAGSGCGLLVGYLFNRWDGAAVTAIIGAVISTFLFLMMVMVMMCFVGAAYAFAT